MTEHALRPSILVVDDEPRILDSMRDLLEESFEVVASTDGEEALQLLRTAKFTVILADQRMPGLTGDQFLAKAQEISDATRILVTGYADINALIRAVNHGQIFTYIAKPWKPAELKVTVFKAAAHARKVVEQKAAADMVARQQEALAQSEAVLRQQTKILQSILDSMGDGVIVSDQNGKMVLLNPAARQMVGPREDVPQEQWSHSYGIYCPDTMAPYPAGELPLAKALQGETVDATELYIRNSFRPDGAFISVNGRPLKDDSGKAKGGVAVIRDITAAKRSEDLLRKAKEEAERANHAKSEFLSRMSHELRTPLNSILGFAQLLEMDALSEDQQDSLAHIMKGGQHLLSLINEVLDLARIEAGRLSLSSEPIHLQEVIQEALSFVRPIAQQRNIQVRCDSTINSERYVKADQQRLRQVFLNLLLNAAHALDDERQHDDEHKEAHQPDGDEERNVLHGREESEIVEHLDKVVECDEPSALGKSEVQRVQHRHDTEGQKQQHVATREYVANVGLGAGSALRAPGCPPPPPLWRGGGGGRYLGARDGSRHSLLDRVAVDLGVVLVSLLPLVCDRVDGFAGGQSRSHDLSPSGLGAEGERRTPSGPDVAGCASDDVLERVRVGPVSAVDLSVQPLARG